MNFLKSVSILFLFILSFSWYSCADGENQSETTISMIEKSVDTKDSLATSKSNVEGQTDGKVTVNDNKIGQVLTSIAENMESEKLAYDIKLGQDASGIFHSIKDRLQSRMPALAEGDKYIYPSFEVDRITRQIADWYFKNDNLIIVEDAMKSRNSIQPGSVMFYGKSDEVYKNINIDLLTDRDNKYSLNGAIMHIAVVTAVTKDEEGNVIDYTIMHGRRPGRTAARSVSKEVQSSRTKGLPPFGNWKQQWIAMANIITLKK